MGDVAQNTEPVDAATKTNQHLNLGKIEVDGQRVKDGAKDGE